MKGELRKEKKLNWIYNVSDRATKESNSDNQVYVHESRL